MTDILVAAPLAVIALIHGLWGLKIWWPIRAEPALARAVVGARDIQTMPPPAPSFAVAFALLLAAFWALALSGRISLAFAPDWLVSAGGISLAAIFLLRGLAGYTPFWARLCPEQPFRRLDRLIYSPLCLLLGLGFLVLLRQ